MSEWIKVDGYKNLPEGNWLVRLEESILGSKIHVANTHQNCTFIGGSLAFDMPKVVEYRPLPE